MLSSLSYTRKNVIKRAKNEMHDGDDERLSIEETALLSYSSTMNDMFVRVTVK